MNLAVPFAAPNRDGAGRGFTLWMLAGCAELGVLITTATPIAGNETINWYLEMIHASDRVVV